MAAEEFPGVIEIVDIYHARQHLCDVDKAIHGRDRARQRPGGRGRFSEGSRSVSASGESDSGRYVNPGEGAARSLAPAGEAASMPYRVASRRRRASARSKALALRVDLSALAVELTRDDGADGRWRFEGVEHITPRMYRQGGASILTPEDIRRRLEAALRAGAPAWNPYG